MKSTLVLLALLALPVGLSADEPTVSAPSTVSPSPSATPAAKKAKKHKKAKKATPTATPAVAKS